VLTVPDRCRAVAVPDADAVAEYVGANAGAITMGPTDTPFGRALAITDRWGAALSLIDRSSAEMASASRPDGRPVLIGRFAAMVNDAYPPKIDVQQAVARALAEDLTPLGDLTSAMLPDGITSTSQMVVRGVGALAGRLCAAEAFHQVDPSIKIEWHADDGDSVGPMQKIADITGPLATVLEAERTALNFMGHLSGIATRVQEFVQAVDGQIGVWDTRKTTPGLRSLEKAAVRAGGGRNHRGNLSDWLMFKDNHLTGMSIGEAVAAARDRWPARTLHVECDRPDQVVEAVAANADAILLDNMSPDEVRACIAIIGERRPDGRPLVEASGGITIDTIASYADTGVDYVSSGSLTNSAPVLDIGLDIEIDR